MPTRSSGRWTLALTGRARRLVESEKAQRRNDVPADAHRYEFPLKNKPVSAPVNTFNGALAETIPVILQNDKGRPL